MGDDSFILMNLKDSKEIAAAMQNDTAQRILDFLTKGKATESEIAKELNIAMSTVHYNLQLLKKAKLVIADEYHYSKKGKEVLHYKLAKKLIIIAPGDESNWKSLLKKVIPAFGIVAIIGYITKFFNKPAETLAMAKAPVADAMVRSTPTQEMAMMDSAETLSMQAPSFWQNMTAFEWFMLGAISIVAILLIIELFSSKQWFKSKKP